MFHALAILTTEEVPQNAASVLFAMSSIKALRFLLIVFILACDLFSS